MPRVIGFESTPNPHAVKILLDGALSAPPRSYREPPPPGCSDALAVALYAIEGVRVVLIHHQFVSVGKDPDAKWPTIKRKAKAAIQAHNEPPHKPTHKPSHQSQNEPPADG